MRCIFVIFICKTHVLHLIDPVQNWQIFAFKRQTPRKGNTPLVLPTKLRFTKVDVQIHSSSNSNSYCGPSGHC